jgi:hypothetical protein
MLFTIKFCIVALGVCAFIGAVGISLVQLWSMMK